MLEMVNFNSYHLKRRTLWEVTCAEKTVPEVFTAFHGGRPKMVLLIWGTVFPGQWTMLLFIFRSGRNLTKITVLFFNVLSHQFVNKVVKFELFLSVCLTIIIIIVATNASSIGKWSRQNNDLNFAHWVDNSHRC